MAKSKNRGRKSWPPIKAKFLEACRDQWEDARRGKKMALFYDRLTAAFIARFGYDLDLNVDPKEEANVDVVPRVDGEKIPGLGGLSEEEREEKAQYFGSLRTKLSVWCNHHYRKVNDSAFRDETNALFRQIAGNECEALRRKPDYQVYQTLYYKTRVLSTFNERWATAVADAKANNLPNPSLLSIRQKAVQECWDKETPEIKEEVRKSAQAEYERRKEELEDYTVAPSTPEEYQSRLDHCAPFIKAIAEGLRERLGLAVSILLAGPIPAADGDIGLRSYHAGATDELSPRKWPEFDRSGFNQVETSMLTFASRVYPLDERQRRALPLSADTSRSDSPVTADMPASLESRLQTPVLNLDTLGHEPTPGPPPQPSVTEDPGATGPSLALPTIDKPPTPTIHPPQPSATSESSPLATPPSPSPASPASPAADKLPATAVQGTAVSLPSRILIDGGCPSRLANTYLQLVATEFDVAWTACVAAFARLQVKSGFQDPRGAQLPLALRPTEYAVWYKCARQSSGPPIESHQHFLARLAAWWWSLQPATRGDDGRLRSSAPADWSSILRPGRNGIFLVLCGLLWVGNAIFVGEETALLADWSSLVDDVAWALEHDFDVPDAAADTPSSKRAGKSTSSRPRKRARV